MNDEHAERDADGDRKRHGDDNEGQMSGGGLEDFGAMLEEERPGRHASAPGNGVRHAVKARTSGWSIPRNSWGEQSAIIRPFSRRIMREASRSASRRSWVTKTMVLRRRRARELNSR